MTQETWKPEMQRPVPAATVESVTQKKLRTADLTDHFVLLWYEDRESTSVNQLFKDQLADQRDSVGYGPDVLVVAVADVSSFDWWPAKRFVIKALKEAEAKSGFDIYCDWTGDIRGAFGFGKGASNLAVLDHGKLRTVQTGPIPEAVASWLLDQTKSDSQRNSPS